MSDRIAGFLEVGLTEAGDEVVIDHPDLKPDANGVGHIVFSPAQARNLALLLLQKARDAEGIPTEPPAGWGRRVEDMLKTKTEGMTVRDLISILTNHQPDMRVVVMVSGQSQEWYEPARDVEILELVTREPARTFPHPDGRFLHYAEELQFGEGVGERVLTLSSYQPSTPAHEGSPK